MNFINEHKIENRKKPTYTQNEPIMQIYSFDYFPFILLFQNFGSFVDIYYKLILSIEIIIHIKL